MTARCPGLLPLLAAGAIAVGLVLLTAGACKVGTSRPTRVRRRRSGEPPTRDSDDSDSGATDAPRAPATYAASRSRGTYRCDDQVVDVTGGNNTVHAKTQPRVSDTGGDNDVFVQ